MRLINATKLVSDIIKERDKIPLTVVERYSFGVSSPNRHGQSMRGGIRKALRCIEQAPTIDAVPVVRCKDCSWNKKSSFCRRHGHYVREDFFCAYGTTGDIEGLRPQKKAVKKAEERCLATGGECSRCNPGPCDHRRTVIPDDRGQ